MIRREYASVSSVLALLVAFISIGERVEGEVYTHFVRATHYHKTDPNCDHWTASGYTSTQIRLPDDDTIVKNRNQIGNVAVDPKYVPEGSLVFETQTKRFFVSTTGGTAVIDRRSARSIAQMQGLCSKHSNALVFDFYYPDEIVDNHYTECVVIPHKGKKFRVLNLVSQERRLDPLFWIPLIQELYDASDDEAEKQNLRLMIFRLQEMSLRQKILS